jgi:hypothetical protein
VDNETKGALEGVNVTQAGIVLAIAALAEVLIKEKILDADRLIAHLEKPSDLLVRAGAGEAASLALKGVISYLRMRQSMPGAASPTSH